MNIQEVLDRLKAGNERFVNDQLKSNLNDQPRRAELTGGQQPWAIILSCADSRVVPEMLSIRVWASCLWCVWREM